MDEQGNIEGFGQPAANGEDSAPMANVLSQYVKDLSFENPNAPAIYQVQGAPKLDVQFNIGAAQVGEDVHEVVLKIEARGEIEGQVMYLCELSFAGLFGLRNIPNEHLQPFLLGEAPRILFPFARRVLADAVRDGGFPPLLLEPIDFGALYFQQQAQAAAAETGEIAGEGIGHA
ncbi:protein-export chaperone SecB [Sphingomonas qomolangmaensis]|uniref:Protein-export protein SecB n=1 Tax=Sphingomonas qomolangmaensis TaxID=2918765 RepID=A0ABY5LB62_9SPHN|nr:protein-export chaperone SecB [Sphingomonas qomolangmaensis]UUL83029.1 protein-export chaperone SecB [Sphingomonas qomolangmaensis]